MLKPAMLKTVALAAALALPLAAPALAATVTVEVDATAHSSNLGTGLATGIFVNPGYTLSVMADPRDGWWSLGAEDPPCTRITDADGLDTTCYGPYTQGNLTARYGTLVGRIGTGDFFVVGSLFEAVVTEAGQLYLFNWDSDANDNSGAITVAISAVPLPAGGLLLLGAMGGLAALRRRRG